MYFRQKRIQTFWNMIRKSKGNNGNNFEDIPMERLECHFNEKFSYDKNIENEFICDARSEVASKYDNCLSCYADFTFTEYMLKKYIKALKLGTSPGSDGILSEHLKFALDTNILSHLCKVITICFQYSVVPKSFINGLLVPILKKPTLDPTLAKNYRPVTVSSIVSKILELYIIDECSDFKFNSYQFGFIKGRGTATATTFVNDVISYFDFKGSPLFICTLDAEGAYDGIPHPILFKKAIGVIPDCSRKLLHNWYSNMTVQVKWDRLSNPIKVSKGTRQGGLTSSFLFNLFYKDMIDELESHSGGCAVDNMKLNVFCYADDLLLVSTSVTGLQGLINCANMYVTKHGLKFNPGKTKCLITGKNPFVSIPSWYLNENILQICENFDYLGVHIGNKGNNVHVESRISSCRRAFYTLQSAGLCKKGLDVESAIYVFKSACRSIFTYGCETMYLSKANRRDLDICQGKLIKCIVGLSPKYRTTPLLQALNIQTVARSVDFCSISLLNNVLRNESGASRFYLMLIQKSVNCPKLLTSRVRQICNDWNFNYILSCLSQEYIFNIKKVLLNNIKNGQDGLVYSIRQIVINDNNYRMLQLLLKSF